MLKKILPIILLLVLLTPNLVHAQESMEFEPPKIVIQDTEGLKVQLVTHTQNPDDKTVRLELVIYSQIQSDRVQISWESNGVVEILSDVTETLSLVPNQTYTTFIIVRPRFFGVSTITAKVEAFEAQGTYTATASLTIGSYTDGSVFPVTSEFLTAQTVNTINKLMKLVFWGYVLVFALYFAYQQYKRFLKKDENIK